MSVVLPRSVITVSARVLSKIVMMSTGCRKYVELVDPPFRLVDADIIVTVEPLSSANITSAIYKLKCSIQEMWHAKWCNLVV